MSGRPPEGRRQEPEAGGRGDAATRFEFSTPHVTQRWIMTVTPAPARTDGSQLRLTVERFNHAGRRFYSHRHRSDAELWDLSPRIDGKPCTRRYEMDGSGTDGMRCSPTKCLDEVRSRCRNSTSCVITMPGEWSRRTKVQTPG